MRKLYERSHADNHVDERSFLASLRTNLGVVAFEFWPCVRSAFEVVHQMSSVSVLLVAGDHLARSEMETNHLAVFISMLLLLGGLLRTRMLLRERAHAAAPRASALRFLADAIVVDAVSVCRSMWVLLCLTPVLHSLTQTFADDTIGVLVALAAAVHLFFYDYASDGEPRRSIATGASAVSLNAAILLAVLLGSRLDTRAHVFGFDVIAALILVVLPRLRLRLAARTGPVAGFVLSAVLPVLTAVLIATVSRSLAGIYLISSVLVCFGAPLLIVKMQRLKNRIAGPWDIARLETANAAGASSADPPPPPPSRSAGSAATAEAVCFYFPHRTRSDRSGRGVLEEDLVERRDFKTVASARECTLLWSSAFPSARFMRELRPTVRMNHLPRSTELSHKQRLYASPVAKEPFFAPSFVLPAHAAALRRALEEDEGNDGLWIVKPGRSGSGRQVRVLKSAAVRKLLDGDARCDGGGEEETLPLSSARARRAQLRASRSAKKAPKLKSKTKAAWVVSQYIANPMLVRGRKVDLRAYVLLLRERTAGSSGAGCTRAFLYADGLVRFAAEPYSLDAEALEDECVHLTNNTVSRRRGVQHGAVENETWQELEAWMEEGNAGALRWKSGVLPQLEHAAFTAVRDGMLSLPSTQAALAKWPERTAGCFELLGMDFLIDDVGTVWLLEVNSMPELEMTPHARADRDVNARLVPHLFDLVLGTDGSDGDRSSGVHAEGEGFIELGRVEDTW